METVYEEHAKIFKAFCDEKRLRILELLRGGEKCACVLLEQLDLGQSGLSYHMKILVESGIVESRQEGKWTHYKISKKGSAYAGILLKDLTTPDTTEEHCSSCCESAFEKKVVVEYLYLDLRTCDRCIGADNVLDEVMLTLTPALELAGYEVEYNKVKMETAELAKQYQFLSSPTIRVNGRDICQSVAENSCGCCSEISGTDVDCRVFEYNGETYEVPPEEMLAEAILHAVFEHSEPCSCSSYELPENLKTFYEGKKSKSCGGTCC